MKPMSIDHHSLSIHIKRSITILACIIMITTVVPALPTKTDTTIYTIAFNPQSLTITRTNGIDTITFPNAIIAGKPGTPAIPSKTIAIAIPATITITGVTIRDQTTQSLPGVYVPATVQPPLPTSIISPASLVTTDPLIGIYPDTPIQFVEETDICGQGIAYLQFNPIQYNAQTHMITITTSLSIQLQGIPGRIPGDYLPVGTSQVDREEKIKDIQNLVINPEQVQLQQTTVNPSFGLPSGGPYAFSIITTSSDASYWQNFADWHTKRGLRTVIVTTTYIYSNYAGSSNQQKIRNFIIDAYNNWACYFYLLGGEPSSSAVPSMTKTYNIDWYNYQVWGDQYYTDFDDDWTSETYVGRVSTSGSSQITLFTNKVLTYETNPPMTNFAQRATMQGMDLDSTSPAEDFKESDINDTYVPDSFTVTTVYDSQPYSPTTHRQKFINAINAGQNLVNHADHSNTDVMGMGYVNHDDLLSVSDVDAFTNTGKLCNIISLGCDPNDMSQEDCISEHFVIYNSNEAGVSFTGDTGYGWYSYGDPGAYTGRLDKGCWQAIFSNNKYTLGEMISQSKNNYGSVSQDIDKYCFYSFELLGDPAMNLWTANPSTFSVTHPTTLPTGPSSFTVHVTSSGSNVNNALVCLWKGTEVYQTLTTNTAGDATFTPNPTTTGPMNVTVTKQNYLPNTTTATVIISNNTSPEAFDDTTTVNEDSTNNQINVLANDHDDDGDTITILSVTQPTHGQSSTDNTFTYYTPAANYHGQDSFTYTIQDIYGATDSATVSITVSDINDQPAASFTYEPTPVRINKTVFFNSTSTDVDGTIVNWTWNFGDSTMGYGERVTHIYTQIESVSVTLTVRDDDGAEASTTIVISVQPIILTVDAGGPYTCNLGQSILFNGSAAGGLPPYSYSWDFGDGNTSSEQNPHHTYHTAGLFTVTLEVTDSEDVVASGTTSATVNPDTIAPSISVVKPKANMFYLFNNELFTLTRTVVIGPITVTVHAEDYETGMNRVEIYVDSILESASTSGPDYTCQWATPGLGTKTLRVKAIDNAGNTKTVDMAVLKIL
jgi:PKD repeat protein